MMGAGFVRHLLEQGHDVNVWNRNAAPDADRIMGVLGDVNRLATFNPGQMLPGRAARIASGEFSPP